MLKNTATKHNILSIVNITEASYGNVPQYFHAFEADDMKYFLLKLFSD